MNAFRPGEITVPVHFDANRQSDGQILDSILDQRRRFGFDSFCLIFPGGGHRNTGYPSIKVFTDKAKRFSLIKKALAAEKIRLGWYNALTIKSGDREGFRKIIRLDGTPHPFANCPLSPGFRERFTDDVAQFAKLAKPDFIIFEDDFSLAAADGCFCEAHLARFREKYGEALSRKELGAILTRKAPEDLSVIKKWREFTKETMAEFSRQIREKVDEESPEIPIGLCQSGGDVLDGFGAIEVSRALAGKRHRPFVRFEGADYNGLDPARIPRILYHAVYCRQLAPDVDAILEADTYPHTRYFTSAKAITAQMAIGYSYGFDGALFHAMQQLDDPGEESGYGGEYLRNKKLLEAIRSRAKLCRQNGVSIPYDPFFYSLNDKWHSPPLWTECVSRFGIPFTTLDSPVRFWDGTAARRFSDAEIKKALSGALFLDGSAAGYLCERGYGEYLGVRIGGDVSQRGKLRLDLAAREVIRDGFRTKGRGANMFTAWMYSPGGNGVARELIPEGAKVVTEIFDSEGGFVTDGMTRFENSLGGRIVVTGMTLEKNSSGSLYNYRRKRLICDQLVWCGADCFFELEAPNVSIVDNTPVKKTDFRRMLTVTNLCADPMDGVSLHVPGSVKKIDGVDVICRDGRRRKANFILDGSALKIERKLEYCESVCILIK